MLKTHKRTLILASILTILPILVGVYFWKELPDPMATHFGFSGGVDGYSPKAFAVFGLPLIFLAVLWVGSVVISKDPKKQNISSKMFTLVLWLFPVLSLVANVAIYSVNLGYNLEMSRMVNILLGVLFIIIGNYLPKARQNYSIGIRIPWTLANEDNWNRTHRFAGFLWVIGGLLIVLLSFINFLPGYWFVSIILVIALVPCLYSFWLHVKQ